MKKKIVLIGSGSQYTEFFLQEVFKFEEFKGCTIALVDRNRSRLDIVMGIAQKLNSITDWGVIFEGSIDRREVLHDAMLVYCFIAVDSKRTWKEDFNLCEKHGISEYECQTTGVGGLSEAIRHVPPVLDLCADMEQLCPGAWLVLNNNPLSKILAAVLTHTKVKAFGYCYGHELVEMALEQILGMTERDASTLKAGHVEREYMCPAGNLNVKQVGINHMLWVTDIRDTKTGEDLYPKLRQLLASGNNDTIPAAYRFCAELGRLFGYFATPADNHVADYMWIDDDDTILRYGLTKIPVDDWFGGRDDSAWEAIAKSIVNAESAKAFIGQRRTGWLSTHICVSMFSGQPNYFPEINVINNGAVPNLSSNIIVEVPGVIGPDFVKPIQMDPLPEYLKPVCELHGTLSNLAGNAAALGSKDLALQYLLYYPKIGGVNKAQKVLDDIIALNKPYNTRF